MSANGHSTGNGIKVDLRSVLTRAIRDSGTGEENGEGKASEGEVTPNCVKALYGELNGN